MLCRPVHVPSFFRPVEPWERKLAISEKESFRSADSQQSKMADEELLCTLESLPGILDHSEKSWTEVNDILEKLKTWATVKTNR